ncbi:MAG: hypothetical protein LBF87_00780 [Treponema sp.]|jgi:hypothetical protein|nr:hypothetical protein [Treponema sp.]
MNINDPQVEEQLGSLAQTSASFLRSLLTLPLSRRAGRWFRVLSAVQGITDHE